MTRSLIAASLLLLLQGCAGEELFHGLDERQANEVLVALDEAGLSAEKRREEGADGGWLVEVRPKDAGAARRLLAERELPRTRAPGFADLFEGSGMVPTPLEEHARYLQALSGELARTVEALDGVVEARVHLGLPQEDPLRPGSARAPRAAVLLRCRPAACPSVRSLEPSLRALVAGAADGLSAETVSVLIAEAEAAALPATSRRGGGAWRAAGAVALALVAALLIAIALRRTPLRFPARVGDP
jgi:type III secretion protein J